MLPGRRADNGSIFVVQGPAPAGSLMEGGIAVTPLGAIYISELATSFSPIDLFQNNEQGAWYDPSDLSTMFQDSAGTTPVTADGQPVGLILDKSGRNNHAFQATAAERPLHKTSGGLHWLQFDGVDDALSTAAINFTSTDKMSVFSGEKHTTNNVGTLAQLGNDNTNGMFFVRTPGHVANTYGVGICGSSAQSTPLTSATYAPPITSVLSFAASLSTNIGSTSLRINAVDSGLSNSGVTGISTFANAVVGIGVRPPLSSVFFNGNIYSLIVLSRLAATQEIDDTEAWVADKTGVVLP